MYVTFYKRMCMYDTSIELVAGELRGMRDFMVNLWRNPKTGHRADR